MKYRAIVLSLGAAMLTLGCSSLTPPTPLAIEPVMKVRNGGVDAEGMYFVGRAYQGQGRHAEAVRAFRAALALEPMHVEARNALGASYFAQGRADLAEAQFLAALALAPDSPHLRNNLARLYVLTGSQPSEALAAADAAAREAAPPAAAPQNPAADTAVPAATPAAAAAPLAVVAPVAAVTPAKAAVPVVAAPTPAAVSSGALVSVASNVWELKAQAPTVRSAQVPQAVASPPPVVAAPSAPAAAIPASVAARVEVSNGNGVTGLARRVAQFMQTQGYRQTRTNNLQSFNQRSTEIQYRAGAQGQARELAALLGVPPRLVVVSALERQATVRLVLGRDYRQLAVTPTAPPALAMLQLGE